MMMLSREAIKASPGTVFTEAEQYLLDRAASERLQKVPRDLNFYVRAVARLGGYLDRASDAPPGTTVLWRGLSRLADLVEGARTLNYQNLKLVGNCKPNGAHTVYPPQSSNYPLQRRADDPFQRMGSDLNTSFFPYTRLQALYASVARRSMVMRSQFHLL
jgi:hypothetical protein